MWEVNVELFESWEAILCIGCVREGVEDIDLGMGCVWLAVLCGWTGLEDVEGKTERQSLGDVRLAATAHGWEVGKGRCARAAWTGER